MIKKILLFTAGSLFLFAAENQNMQMSAEDMFLKLKPRMSKMYTQMLPAIDKTKKCIEEAKSKKDVLSCGKFMMKASDMQMHEEVINQKISDKDLKDFEWNDKIKQKTLADLEKTKTQMQKMQKCIDKSQNMQSLNTCMKEVGVER